MGRVPSSPGRDVPRTTLVPGRLALRPGIGATRQGGASVGNNKVTQIGVPVAVVSIVLMMIVPMPTILLDFLITINITGALAILLMSMFVKKPLDFGVFPALLLVATLFRLALNISATRLVLTDGYAGKVIDAFGHFVVGGSLVVGLVIFLILVVIQFLVITKGAERVAEVGARFTLDAMPGKQMAIDADLNAGLIDEAQARRRRAEVSSEADFYGAMDGGSKFVKGDAVAAIVITIINLVGGFLVGVVQKKMSMGEAVQTYSLLTVGDGLVSQIPALLLSVATGLIVTRSATSGTMGGDIATQFGKQKLAMRLAGGGVLALMMIPGLPKLPFLVVGGAVLVIASRLPDADDEPSEQEQAEAAHSAEPPPDSADALVNDMHVDALALELAPDLVDLVDGSVGGDLLDRVKALRRKVALELGMIIPPVRTRDNLELPFSTYAVKVGGVVAGRGEAPPGQVLAIGDDLEALPGRATTEPVFGLAAKWVPEQMRHQAELHGATVVDRASVITTHMAEVVREQAARLLNREDVKAMVDAVKRHSPVAVDELVPSQLTLGEVQQVLQALLNEQVCIRDLPRIFEGLSLKAKSGSDPEGLVEAARAALGPAIAAPYVAGDTLAVITLDPMLEQKMFEHLRGSEAGTNLLLDAQMAESIGQQVAHFSAESEQRGQAPILACSPQLRPALYRLISLTSPRVPVLSYSEVGGSITIETVGRVSFAHAVAA